MSVMNCANEPLSVTSLTARFNTLCFVYLDNRYSEHNYICVATTYKGPNALSLWCTIIVRVFGRWVSDFHAGYIPRHGFDIIFGSSLLQGC